MKAYYLYKEDEQSLFGFSFARISDIREEDNIEEVYRMATGIVHAYEKEQSFAGDTQKFVWTDFREININGFGEVTEEEYRKWISSVEEETGIKYNSIPKRGKPCYVG